MERTALIRPELSLTQEGLTVKFAGHLVKVWVRDFSRIIDTELLERPTQSFDLLYAAGALMRADNKWLKPHRQQLDKSLANFHKSMSSILLECASMYVAPAWKTVLQYFQAEHGKVTERAVDLSHELIRLIDGAQMMTGFFAQYNCAIPEQCLKASEAAIDWVPDNYVKLIMPGCAYVQALAMTVNPSMLGCKGSGVIGGLGLSADLLPILLDGLENMPGMLVHK